MKSGFIRPLMIVACAHLGSASPALAGCEPWIARLASFQGRVQAQSAESPEWRPVAPQQAFCPGDKIRTLERSRARLQLRDETYLALDQKSTVIFAGIKPEEPSWLDVLKGAIYVRSRTPTSLDVRTPFVNALIKGTEFLVAAGAAQGQVTVFEGVVDAYNPHGRLTLTGGQSAVAEAGRAPERKILLRPEDAVQWTLYYPPLLDLAALERSASPVVREALGHYSAGDLESALSALDAAPDAVAPLLRAELLLSLGRVDEAEPVLHAVAAREPANGEAVALQAVIALARNERDTARVHADRAVSLDPASPVPWTALSYVEQADFRLEDALKSARKAAARDPGNALAYTRLAELHASLGRRTEAQQAAEKAIALSPTSARAHAVLGYVRLMAMDAKKAERSFREAIGLDSADPLPRFGLGLAEIRRGRLEEGTADLELAASLDPNDALIRSYLGKAYYDLKRGKVAETEFAMAKTLDPKDPSPWFYDAIKKQTENRPVDALHDLQEAIERNDNRAVYRSRMALDDDLAARSASLGRIYNDLGFGQRALVEGWKSVNTDPGNYSGHRFLADSYTALPRHEIARVSELLQSQLLQPINVTPVQPQLGEGDLLLVSGSGPATPSFNEFNPLFARDRFALQASGIVGSNDTYGDEVTHSGIWNNVSYSLGQYHYETDGFRTNNDVNDDIYNAFVQANVTPDFSVQAEVRHREFEHGDLNLNAFNIPPVNEKFRPDFRRDVRSDTVRAGARFSPAPHSDFIVSAMYLDSDEFQDRGCIPTCNQNSFDERAYLAEGQYLYSTPLLNVVLGGGHYGASLRNGSGPTATERIEHDDVEHGNAYLYTKIRYPDRFTWTLGASYDALSDGRVGDFDRVNPKLGLTFEPLRGTTIRIAGFRTLKRSLFFADRTIEPTQVAGFNQFYDDRTGTRSKRYGIGLDQRFAPNLFAGVEASKRKLEVPAEDEPTFHWTEELYRAYVHWAFAPDFALNVAFELEDFRNNQRNPQTPDTTTYMVPANLRYFHPTGFFGRVGTTYVNQEAVADGNTKAYNEFALVDLGIGYRFPRRLGILSLNVSNLFDEEFDYQGLGFRTLQGESQPFQPDRTVSAQITLAF